MDSFDSFVDQKVLDVIEKKTVRSVCDYGCGEGGLLSRLAEKKVIDGSLAGVDVFSQFCCGNRKPPSFSGIEFIDRDSDVFGNLIRDRRFDLVVSSQTLHHFRTPVRELRNLWQLTREGGYVLFVDVDFSRESDGQITKNLHSLLAEALSAMRGSFHRHHLTLDEALDLISAVPFEVVEAKTEKLNPHQDEKRETTDRVVQGVVQTLEKITFKNPLVGDVFHQAFRSFRKLAESTGVEYTSLMCILLKKPEGKSLSQ